MVEARGAGRSLQCAHDWRAEAPVIGGWVLLLVALGYLGVLFAIVTIGSAFLLKETVSAQHLVGLALILVGVVVVSQVA